MKRHSVLVRLLFALSIVCALAIPLSVARAVGVARVYQPDLLPRDETSRGVIILPSKHAAELAHLSAGDTPVLAGKSVKVEKTDPQAGLLVSSAALGDTALAQALVTAGIAAEVNHPRHILPITPTAELFSTPQATRPEDLPNKPDFWHIEQGGADIDEMVRETYRPERE